MFLNHKVFLTSCHKIVFYNLELAVKSKIASKSETKGYTAKSLTVNFNKIEVNCTFEKNYVKLKCRILSTRHKKQISNRK